MNAVAGGHFAVRGTPKNDPIRPLKFIENQYLQIQNIQISNFIKKSMKIDFDGFVLNEMGSGNSNFIVPTLKACIIIDLYLKKCF